MIYRLPAHTHHSKLSVLYGPSPLEQVISIGLFATSHAEVKTFGETLDFQMKFVGIKEATLIKMEITLKRELTENYPKDVKDQTFQLGKVGDK